MGRRGSLEADMYNTYYTRTIDLSNMVQIAHHATTVGSLLYILVSGPSMNSM